MLRAVSIQSHFQLEIKSFFKKTLQTAFSEKKKLLAAIVKQLFCLFASVDASDDFNYQNFYIFFGVKLHRNKKVPIAK